MHPLTCPNTEEPQHSLSFFLLVCFLQIGLEDDQAGQPFPLKDM